MFCGESTKPFVQENCGVVQEYGEPCEDINVDCRFKVSRKDSGGELTLNRLDRRQSLLGQLDPTWRRIEAGRAVRTFDRYQEMMYSLPVGVHGPRVANV
jgi:hypothetical protein